MSLASEPFMSARRLLVISFALAGACDDGGSGRRGSAVLRPGPCSSRAALGDGGESGDLIECTWSYDQAGRVQSLEYASVRDDSRHEATIEWVYDGDALVRIDNEYTFDEPFNDSSAGEVTWQFAADEVTESDREDVVLDGADPYVATQDISYGADGFAFWGHPFDCQPKLLALETRTRREVADEVSPDPYVVEYEYDGPPRQGDRIQTEFEVAGDNRESVSQSLFRYDASGRLIRYQYESLVGLEVQIFDIPYDDAGHILEWGIDENRYDEYIYDDAGNLISVVLHGFYDTDDDVIADYDYGCWED